MPSRTPRPRKPGHGRRRCWKRPAIARCSWPWTSRVGCRRPCVPPTRQRPPPAPLRSCPPSRSARSMRWLDPVGSVRPRVLDQGERDRRAAAQPLVPRPSTCWGHDPRRARPLDLGAAPSWSSPRRGCPRRRARRAPRGDLLSTKRCACRWPSLLSVVGAPGALCGAAVELTDVYPRFWLSGIPSSDGLDGRSLLPVLRIRASVKEAASPWSPRSRPGRTLGTHVVPLQRSGPTGSEELFDHEADPHEFTNLARAAHVSTVAEMRRLVASRYRGGRAAPPWPAAAPRAGLSSVLLVMLDDLNALSGRTVTRGRRPTSSGSLGDGRLPARLRAGPHVQPSRSSLLTAGGRTHGHPGTTSRPCARSGGRAAPAGVLPRPRLLHGRVGKVYEESWRTSRLGADDERAAPTKDPAAKKIRCGLLVGADGQPRRARARRRRARQAVQGWSGSGTGPSSSPWASRSPNGSGGAPEDSHLYPPTPWHPGGAGDDLEECPRSPSRTGAERPGVVLAGRDPLACGPIRSSAVTPRGLLGGGTFADAQGGVRWMRSTAGPVGSDRGGPARRPRLPPGGPPRPVAQGHAVRPSLRNPLVIAAPQVRAGLAREPPSSCSTSIHHRRPGRAARRVRPRRRSLGVDMILDPARGVRPAALSFRRPGAAHRHERADRAYRYTLWPDGSEEYVTTPRIERGEDPRPGRPARARSACGSWAGPR